MLCGPALPLAVFVFEYRAMKRQTWHTPATSLRGVVAMCCIPFRKLFMMQLAIGDWGLTFANSASSVVSHNPFFFPDISRSAEQLSTYTPWSKDEKLQDYEVPTKQTCGTTKSRQRPNYVSWRLAQGEPVFRVILYYHRTTLDLCCTNRPKHGGRSMKPCTAASQVVDTKNYPRWLRSALRLN